jgi:hypothetical protein
MSKVQIGNDEASGFLDKAHTIKECHVLDTCMCRLSVHSCLNLESVNVPFYTQRVMSYLTQCLSF